MNNYKKLIDRFVDIFDSAEEYGVNTEIVVDSDLAYDVAKELEFLGKPFFIETEDQFERDLYDNEILGVTMCKFKDNEIEYFLQPVLDKRGVNTLTDEVTHTLIIQEDLMDIVDCERFTELESLIVLELEKDYDCEDCELDGDCECCLGLEEEEFQFDDYDNYLGEPGEEMLEDVVENILSIMIETEENGGCIHCKLKDYLREVLD